MPRNEWALASVKLLDGQDTLPQTVQFSYDENGDGAFYDRLERQDLGFSHVTTTRGDGSTLDAFYKNQNIFESGLVAETIERERAGGNIVQRTHYEYDSRSLSKNARFNALVRRDTFFHESSSNDVNSGVPTRVESYDYDGRGNITSYVDEGEAGTASDDLLYTIQYEQDELTAKHIFKPTNIAARDRDGKVLRGRSVHYRDDGAPDAITSLLVGGKQPDSGSLYTGADETNPTWRFDYDGFGNVRTAIDPKGFTFTYEYDPVTFTYRASTTESAPGFGYKSTDSYDLRFGLLTERRDINGQLQQFEYDGFGRLAKVWGPKDVFDDFRSKLPTIEMLYQPEQQVGTGAQGNPKFRPASARTRHKDTIPNFGPEDPATWDPIETVTFVDGLGRVIQTKKDVEVGTGTSTKVGMTISGKKMFDSRGRLFQEGQPQFGDGAADLFIEAALVRPTTYQYDTVSRLRQVTTPDGAVTTTSYQLETFENQQRLATLLRDANSKVRTSFRSVRGEVVGVQEANTIGGALTTLTTRYEHNPVGELLVAIDAKNNRTSAEYDTLGQMVVLNSPDAGRSEWRFDLSGNVAVRETPNARTQGNLIRYNYLFNRLLSIQYPLAESTDVTYQYGAAADGGFLGGNRAGRVTSETSEAGVKEFRYDGLGFVTWEKMSLRGGNPGAAPLAREMSHSYDSFGRLRETNYQTSNPEIIGYGYDRGGNVTFVRNQRTSNTEVVVLLVSDIRYDEFEQRTRMKYQNGVETRYTYDPETRRLATVSSDLNNGGTPMQRLSYSYDLVGNVTDMRNDVPVQTVSNSPGVSGIGPVRHHFGYDDLYQLTSADGVYQSQPLERQRYSLTMGYDEIGNIRSKGQTSTIDQLANGDVTGTTDVAGTSYAFAYNYENPRPHAPSSIDETHPSQPSARRTLAYDDEGNQTGWEFASNVTRTRELKWTEEGRIREVREDGFSKSTSRYDGEGVRTNHTQAGSDMLYFGDTLTIGDRNRETKHVFIGGERVASKVDYVDRRLPSRTFWYQTDHLASSQFITTETQAIEQHFEYFPSGEVWINDRSSAPTLQPQYAFNGKELDEDTNTFHMGARQYDPRLGLWMSPDPILPAYMQGGFNKGVFTPRNLGLYAYAWNNPVTLRDPTGRCPQTNSSGPCNEAQVAFLDGRSSSSEADNAVTMAAVGIVPFVGDLEDLASLMDSSASTTERLVAAGSLILGLGPLPNVGPAARAADKVNDAKRAVAAEVKAANGATSGGRLADDALVCRGGACTADRFAGGSGVTVDASGRLQSVSVNSAPGATLSELTTTIPNKQVGVTSVGQVRAAGGDVIQSSTRGNPYHSTMSGITPHQAEQLFTPTARNPNAR